MKKTIAIALTLLCLAGCGKRGRLDFPPGSMYPRQYPAARQPKKGQMMPVAETPTESTTEEDTSTGAEE
ncbi:MAG: hypothetical protein J5787_09660 [Alphaproteobacteria bacterium]|nr:hypothetical protein [Alphaproteobacteria bacterium]MBO4643340.1 hypothetical protein [Alphaproteobacteria bacterium]